MPRICMEESTLNEAPVGTYVQWYDQFSLVWEQMLKMETTENKRSQILDEVNIFVLDFEMPVLLTRIIAFRQVLKTNLPNLFSC